MLRTQTNDMLSDEKQLQTKSCEVGFKQKISVHTVTFGCITIIYRNMQI